MEAPLPSQTPLDPQARKNRILGLVWMGAALLLLLCFFLPNYAIGPVKTITGIDLLRGMANDFSALFRAGEDFSSLMMIVMPFLYWGLGFVALVLSISLVLTRSSSGLTLLVVVMSGLAFFLGLLTAILLHNPTVEVEMFAKLMPKPMPAYYVPIGAELLIVGAWFFLRDRGPKESPAIV